MSFRFLALAKNRRQCLTQNTVRLPVTLLLSRVDFLQARNRLFLHYTNRTEKSHQLPTTHRFSFSRHEVQIIDLPLDTLEKDHRLLLSERRDIGPKKLSPPRN